MHAPHFDDDVLAHLAQRRVQALLHFRAPAGHAARAQPDPNLDRLAGAAPPVWRSGARWRLVSLFLFLPQELLQHAPGGFARDVAVNALVNAHDRRE